MTAQPPEPILPNLQALRRKYGFQWTLFGVLGCLRGGGSRFFLSITPRS